MSSADMRILNGTVSLRYCKTFAELVLPYDDTVWNSAIQHCFGSFSVPDWRIFGCSRLFYPADPLQVLSKCQRMFVESAKNCYWNQRVLRDEPFPLSCVIFWIEIFPIEYESYHFRRTSTSQEFIKLEQTRHWSYVAVIWSTSAEGIVIRFPIFDE